MALPLLLPSLAHYGLRCLGYMPKGFIGGALFKMIIITIGLYYAAPLGMAAFPSTGQIKVSEFVF